MIATILPSSTSFHAVEYNERKVSKGVAQLLVMDNFGQFTLGSKYNANNLKSYLELYTSTNDRIKKPQFHVAISCKGNENTEEELVNFAYAYLKEMGYGEKGQPVLMYAHRDTNNTHIHIVTSRVDPNGKKIDHNNERIKSQRVLEKLLKRDNKELANSDIEIAKAYMFSTMSQFKNILNSMGYAVYEKNENLYVKKCGQILANIPAQDIEQLFSKDYLDKERKKQLRAILLKYRSMSSSKEELQKYLKDKFGLNIIFFGKEDAPYGYSIIDHNNKTVYKGGSILKLDVLLDFSTPEEKLENINSFLSKLLDDNPLLDIWALNDKLRKYKAYIRKDTLNYGNVKRNLEPEILDRIKRNNKIKFVENFKPSSKEQVTVLCNLFKYDDAIRDNVSITEEESDSRKRQLDSFAEYSHNLIGRELRAAIRGEGYDIKKDGDKYYAVNFTTKDIITLSDSEFNIDALWKKNEKVELAVNRSQSKHEGNSKGNKKGTSLSGGTGAGSGTNREWEVGSNKDYDKVDDKTDYSLKY